MKTGRFDSLARCALVMAALVVTLAAPPANAVAIQDAAPDFTLKSLSGANLRLEEYRGQVVLINFWASWCGPCRQEMPLLDRLHQRYVDTGFAVLGVNVEGDEKPARELIDKIPVTFPVLIDEGRAGQRAVPARGHAEHGGGRSGRGGALHPPRLQARRRGEVRRGGQGTDSGVTAGCRRRHGQGRNVSMRKSGLIWRLAALWALVPMLAAAAAAAAEPAARPAADDLEEVKQALVALRRDLVILEEELLFPPALRWPCFCRWTWASSSSSTRSPWS
ncbi:MAG: TlpA disulfide reductase family protein [bacterium]